MFMKKLFFTLAIALGSLITVNAQDVGQMWVGGSVNAWSSKDKGSDAVWNAKIMPEFGYVLSDNLAIGANLGYAHGDAGLLFNQDIESVGNTNAYSIAPFLRMSFLKGNMGALFVDGTVGYTYGKVSGVDDALNLLEVGFRPGVAVNVSDKIALTGKFGFAGYQYTKQGDFKNNSFGLNFDMSQFLVGAIVKF